MNKSKINSSNGKVEDVINLFSEKKYSEAINLLDSIYESHNNKPLLLNIKGACFAGMNDFNSAIKFYKSLDLHQLKTFFSPLSKFTFGDQFSTFFGIKI